MAYELNVSANLSGTECRNRETARDRGATGRSGETELTKRKGHSDQEWPSRHRIEESSAKPNLPRHAMAVKKPDGQDFVWRSLWALALGH
jgi:hypothetical protein